MASRGNGEFSLFIRSSPRDNLSSCKLFVPTTDDFCEYPKNKLTSKLPVLIPKSDASIDRLYIVIRYPTIINASPELIIVFLYKWMLKVTFNLEEDWTSYSITINKGTITPISLLKCKLGDNLVYTDGKGTSPTEEEIKVLAGLLLAGPRMKTTAGEAKAEYRRRIIKNILEQVGETQDDEALLLRTEELVQNKHYMTLCSAYDMFMSKFPSHDLSSLRIGTIPTCYMDSSGLGLLSALASKMGVTPDTAVTLVFYEPASIEIDKFLDNQEEITKKDSHLPYCRSMSIVDKSPLSITRCKNLHAYIMSHLRLLGDRRGPNSMCLTSLNNEAILNIVIKLHFHLRGSDLISRRFFIDAGDAQQHDHSSLDVHNSSEDSDSIHTENVDDIVLSKAEEAFQSVKSMTVTSKMCTGYKARLTNVREGTLGFFIKETLTTWGTLVQDRSLFG